MMPKIKFGMQIAFARLQKTASSLFNKGTEIKYPHRVLERLANEILDAINGVVCDFGKKYNVKTPINDRIVEVIKKIQNGELKAEKKNIHLFDDLV